MQGDKLSYVHIVFPLKKKHVNVKSLALTMQHSFTTPQNHPVKETTLTADNIATTNIY